MAGDEIFFLFLYISLHYILQLSESRTHTVHLKCKLTKWNELRYFPQWFSWPTPFPLVQAFHNCSTVYHSVVTFLQHHTSVVCFCKKVTTLEPLSPPMYTYLLSDFPYPILFLWLRSSTWLEVCTWHVSSSAVQNRPHITIEFRRPSVFTNHHHPNSREEGRYLVHNYR